MLSTYNVERPLIKTAEQWNQIMNLLFNGTIIKCNAKQYDELIRRDHECFIEAGHEGNHECHCGLEF